MLAQTGQPCPMQTGLYGASGCVYSLNEVPEKDCFLVLLHSKQDGSLKTLNLTMNDRCVHRPPHPVLYSWQTSLITAFSLSSIPSQHSTQALSRDLFST